MVQFRITIRLFEIFTLPHAADEALATACGHRSASDRAKRSSKHA